MLQVSGIESVISSVSESSTMSESVSIGQLAGGESIIDSVSDPILVELRPVVSFDSDIDRFLDKDDLIIPRLMEDWNP